MTDAGGVTEMSSLQIIDPLHLGFSAESFKRNTLSQRRNLAFSVSHPALGTEIWNSANAYSPLGDILQNISDSNGFHYLMISNIMYLMMTKAKFRKFKY